ncbi:hypothetical protein [Streptomyces sp. FxanaC1]|uniref:hypothetical protein n=1 Tax=unclassified Streptomyces TaxID=2593676 RepID=UPI00037BF0C6|nr:hypothetical protein [Streptomyces sp. FxanaC1]
MTSNNASNAGRAQRAVGSGATGAGVAGAGVAGAGVAGVGVAVTDAGGPSGEVDGNWAGVPGRCCGVIECSW